MPLYTYDCPEGHTFDALSRLRAGEGATPQIPCRAAGCACSASRRTVYRVPVLGVVFEDLDMWSNKLGFEVKSQRDIDRWESENKMHRATAYEDKVAKQEAGHISRRIRSVARSEGTDAAAEVVREINMCEGMNWTPEQYNAYKDMDNAATSISRDDVATVAPAGPAD